MLAFLIIGGIGVALLLVTLVVGDVLDGILDFGGDLFGIETIAGFIGAFGFAGAIAHSLTDGNFGISLVVAIVAGLLIGLAAGYAASQLKKGGDEANVRSGDLTGKPATVVDTIPADGFGSVSLTVSGHLTRLNARCPGGLPAGTPVTISAVLSPTSVAVEPR